MVASDIKEITRDWLLTIPKTAGEKLGKIRKRMLQKAYEGVIHYSVAAKI